MGRLLSFFFALMVFPAVAFASGQVGEYVQVGDGYLGSAATRDAEDTMTDGANLPRWRGDKSLWGCQLAACWGFHHGLNRRCHSQWPRKRGGYNRS